MAKVRRQGGGRALRFPLEPALGNASSPEPAYNTRLDEGERVLIGILSDTHGRADAMALAMQALRNGGAEFFIHCGDVGSEGVLDHLAGAPAAFVWGNTDWDRAAL